MVEVASLQFKDLAQVPGPGDSSKKDVSGSASQSNVGLYGNSPGSGGAQGFASAGSCQASSGGGASVNVVLNDNGVAEVESFASTMTPAQIQQNVAAWDAAIIAALAKNEAQHNSVTSYRFPLYVKLAGYCYTNGGLPPIITGSVVRNRTYKLLDEYSQDWTGSGVKIYENVIQTSGSHGIVGGAVWTTDDFTDYLSVGGLTGHSPVGAIQQFYATGPFVVSPIPLIVLDQTSTKPGLYRTLGIYYQTSSVSINGDYQAGVHLCGH